MCLVYADCGLFFTGAIFNRRRFSQCWRCDDVLCVIEMSRHRTDVIPHLQSTSLVTSGIFGLSDNSIHLGDVFVLAGLVLRWQAHPAMILLVPAFMYVIALSFMKPEEMRLKTGFGDDFVAYCDTILRWLS